MTALRILSARAADADQNLTHYEAAAVGRAFEPGAIALAGFLATPEPKAVFTATGID